MYNYKILGFRFWKVGFNKSKTKKPFTLEETQKFINSFTKGVPEELEYYYYADITNKEFRNCLLKKVERYINYGVRCNFFPELKFFLHDKYLNWINEKLKEWKIA